MSENIFIFFIFFMINFFSNLIEIIKDINKYQYTKLELNNTKKLCNSLEDIIQSDTKELEDLRKEINILDNTIFDYENKLIALTERNVLLKNNVKELENNVLVLIEDKKYLKEEIKQKDFVIKTTKISLENSKKFSNFYYQCKELENKSGLD